MKKGWKGGKKLVYVGGGEGLCLGFQNQPGVYNGGNSIRRPLSWARWVRYAGSSSSCGDTGGCIILWPPLVLGLVVMGLVCATTGIMLPNCNRSRAGNSSPDEKVGVAVPPDKFMPLADLSRASLLPVRERSWLWDLERRSWPGHDCVGRTSKGCNFFRLHAPLFLRLR